MYIINGNFMSIRGQEDFTIADDFKELLYRNRSKCVPQNRDDRLDLHGTESSYLLV